MRRAGLLLMAAVAALAGLLYTGSQSRSAYGLGAQAARGLIHERSVLIDGRWHRMPEPSGGFIASAREAETAAAAVTPTVLPPAPTTLGCSNRTSDGNVRINQDCSLRRQTAGAIAVNPTNSENLVVGYNDSQIGWNHCGFSYSLDGGQTWGAGIAPFFQHENHPPKGHSIDDDGGTMHTYDVASDPSVAFDSRGNAYISCELFDINDAASAILVSKSPASAEGSTFTPLPTYSGSGTDPATGVVIEDNTTNATADEPKLAIDDNTGSKFRDHLYEVWTEFISSPLCTQGGVCSSPIYFAESSNGGQTWSTPTEISGNSRALCSAGNLFDKKRKPHDCDFDEGPDVAVLRNGTIAVVYNNANTSGANVNNQILEVTSKNGGATWTRPALVGADVVTGEPQCNLNDGNGPEECVPGAYIRSNDDPRIAIDPTSGMASVVWTDYSAGRYSIRLSQSTNLTKWTESTAATDGGALDSYMAAIGVVPGTHTLEIGYYGTGRVQSENKHTGLFKLGTGGVGTQYTIYYVTTIAPSPAKRVTQPISPSFSAPDGAQQGYDGDYSGMAITSQYAYPVWSDTRNRYGSGSAVTNDEDVFTARMPVGASQFGRRARP